MEIDSDTETNALPEWHNALTERLDRIEQQLQTGADTFSFFTIALHAYRRHFLPISSAPQHLLSRILADRKLRFPHRKILECLIGHFNPESGAFQELPFNKLVKAARVGKHAAKSYLLELEEAGYIANRNDGYRRWFRMSDQASRGERT